MASNELISEKWKKRKPTYEDFGFTEDDIPKIEEAQEYYNNIDYYSPSDELIKLKQSIDETKYKSIDHVQLPVSFAIVILAITAFFTKGFTEFSWEKLGYAYIIAVVVGIIPAGILMNIIDDKIVYPIEKRMNKELDEKRNLAEALEEKEKSDYLDRINEEYEQWYEKANDLEDYYSAIEVYKAHQRKIKEKQRREREEIKRRQYNYWYGLIGDGEKFEIETRDLLKKIGYSADKMPVGPDDGIDIIAEKNGKRYAVQCKAQEAKVSPSIARDLAGVVAAGHFDGGMLFAINGVSENTREWCRVSTQNGVPIEIWTADEIVKAANTDVRFGAK